MGLDDALRLLATGYIVGFKKGLLNRWIFGETAYGTIAQLLLTMNV